MMPLYAPCIASKGTGHKGTDEPSPIQLSGPTGQTQLMVNNGGGNGAAAHVTTEGACRREGREPQAASRRARTAGREPQGASRSPPPPPAPAPHASPFQKDETQRNRRIVSFPLSHRRQHRTHSNRGAAAAAGAGARRRRRTGRRGAARRAGRGPAASASPISPRLRRGLQRT